MDDPESFRFSGAMNTGEQGNNTQVRVVRREE